MEGLYMIKLIRNQPIAKKYTISHRMKRVYYLAVELNPIRCGRGDCLETKFNPEAIRHHGLEDFIVRQVGLSTWRIWRR